ncbi:MAG: HD-GYP domain-containing protein [Lachnospiraceae bacterium]|nr:HD-GYP domain-containing protein [Lachnospiraceae bacterium]
MCVQAVVTVLLEYNGVEPSYTDAITALCMLEYYIYLSTVYRQGLKDKLDTYVTELNATNLKLENFSKEVITAFVNSIDAKDTYTHGHSARVAEYSRRLAEMNGKSEEECDEIYYAALLHDIGKIGISESIITKEGKLTKEEYESIKLHPVLGAQILGSISEFPYLQVGARYHHERYDGKGYPEGLEGKDIPEMGRIIAVADAYDAMSSKRSYRDPIPQQKVREEIVKGTGTQFDPEYARLMLHLIDEDLEYEMSENVENTDLNGQSELVIGEYRSWTSDGILITPCKTTINLSVTPGPGSTELNPAPALLLFDSLDGKVHTDEKEKKDLNYFEYGEITNVLQAVTLGTRKMEARKKNKGLPELKQKERFRIEAVRIEDHAMITISDRKKSVEFIVALPDSTRYLYIGLTGEHCTYSNIELFKAETESPVGLIPRIAEKISYLDGPEGDVPSIQVDGYRTAHSEGVPVKDGLKISFHIKTLPTARLVWHCPFIDIYCSDDGAVNGASYRDLAFTRFDGECWECDPSCHAELNVKMTDRFRGWDAWKEFNREGYDATVTFRVEDDRITVITENAGIAVSNMFTITGIEKTIYAAVTGDQVAVTDIRIGG